MTEGPLANLLGIEFSPSGGLSNLGLGAALALPKHDTQTYAALGKFIVNYAAAEGALCLLMRRLSGMSDEKARALLSGMRLPELTKFVRTAMAHDKCTDEFKEDVDDCLVQLDHVAKTRHKLVHWTGAYDADAQGLKIHNAFTSRVDLETQVISLTDLSDMTDDCIEIFIRLYDRARPEDIKDRGPRQAWRYTPPKPPSQSKQPPKDRQGQPPRPDASPASQGLTAFPPAPVPPENGQTRQPQSEPPNPE